MNNPDIHKHPKRRMKLKKRREEKETADLLTECARVFLFSLARNRGEERDYESAFRCSGDNDHALGRHVEPAVVGEEE